MVTLTDFNIMVHSLRVSALCAIFTAFSSTCAIAATDTDTKIFDRNFRTLKCTTADNFMSPPVVRLGTDDQLIITFDEIGEDNSFLECRLIHCDRDWQPSRLIESEYIDGFNSMRIEDFAQSYSTFVHYTNYRVVIPSDDLRIIHSGNYLLQVYDPDDPDRTILQTRLQATENITDITAEVNTRTDRGHNTSWQQLSLSLDTSPLGNVNPYQDLTVEVTQNMNGYTKRTIKSPLRVSGNFAAYEHLDNLVFPASNEYRRFEVTSTAFPGMHVDSLRHMGSNYHVWLKTDYPRAESQYSYDRTQHGRYIVREYNATDSDLAADYVTVHFRLESPRIPGVRIYVDGEFTHGVFSPENELIYDDSEQAYTLQIPLKQGAYNYQYVIRRDGESSISSAPIEGDKYETDNEYNIAIWFHPPGARADRLIFAGTIMMR